MIRLLALLLAAGALCLGQKPLLLQQPTLSKTKIAISYAGDLWIVDRDGGSAVRLTTGAGVERGLVGIFGFPGSRPIRTITKRR